MTTPTARNARAEATALLPPGHEARVLEPSPPANTDPDWYADDPTDPAGAVGTIVTPIPGEGSTWIGLAARHADLAAYAADHWLGSYRRLPELPAGYDPGRRALHQIAFFAVAPKRFAQSGKLALRYTHRGFGTPFFGQNEQVRVEDDLLVYQQGDQIRSTPITTLRPPPISWRSLTGRSGSRVSAIPLHRWDRIPGSRSIRPSPKRSAIGPGSRPPSSKRHAAPLRLRR
jgi:hypothetical protein